MSAYLYGIKLKVKPPIKDQIVEWLTHQSGEDGWVLNTIFNGVSWQTYLMITDENLAVSFKLRWGDVI